MGGSERPLLLLVVVVVVVVPAPAIAAEEKKGMEKRFLMVVEVGEEGVGGWGQGLRCRPAGPSSPPSRGAAGKLPGEKEGIPQHLVGCAS